MCDKFSQYLMGIFFVKITPNQPYYLQNCLGTLATTKKRNIIIYLLNHGKMNSCSGKNK